MEKLPEWVKTNEDYERWKKGEKPLPATAPNNIQSKSKKPGRFQNTNNGYIIEISSPGIYTFLFGCFYFAKHGAWAYAAGSFFCAFLTSGLSWFIFPFFGEKIIRETYLRKGWIEL